MTTKEVKRRREQSECDRAAEQIRRDQHQHDEATLQPRVVADRAKPSAVAGVGHNRGPPLDDALTDVLWTADQIARFIKRSPRWVYHQQKNLGLIHIGGTLVGSKTKLTKLLAGEAA